jgi:PAS domain-containing protein
MLEIEHARLASILDNLPVGIWIADKDGKLIAKNEMADSIWTGNAPLLKGIDEYAEYTVWYADSEKQLMPEDYPVAQALITGQAVTPVELTIQRFDGSLGTVLVSAAPVIDRDGESCGVVGINVDITERKKT